MVQQYKCIQTHLWFSQRIVVSFVVGLGGGGGMWGFEIKQD